MGNNIKTALYKACKAFVSQRAKTIKDIISSNQKALASETKSSAGDKHETGRAMLQLEMEKAGQQLQSIEQMQILLGKINIESTSAIIKLGSVVMTDQEHYFLAISAGKISLDGLDFYAVSPHSPIGKLLLGKLVGNTVTFNKPMLIKKVY